MMDLTSVRGLFGLFAFEIAAIVDVFSRFPVAVRAFRRRPSADDQLVVLEDALRHQGRPRHLVSDPGSQFTGHGFRQRLEAHGIRQRFGAVGKTGSIGVIDRFFRTLKENLGLGLWRPLMLMD
jgi:transposase InsO family protein